MRATTGQALPTSRVRVSDSRQQPCCRSKPLLNSTSPWPSSSTGDSLRAVSHTAKDGTEKLIEAHRDYLDIHYCISGSEGIGYADIDTLTPATEYNAEKDYQLLKGEMFKAILNPGDFCIVFPEDAHAPSMIGKGGTDLKKAVVKIKL